MSLVSIQSEFGIELGKLNDPRANSAVMTLKKMYLDLASRSGREAVLGRDIWADKKENTEARRGVSFSLLAESVPEKVYSNLDESQVSDGFLNRFLVIEVRRALQDYNPNAGTFAPSADLIRDLSQLGFAAFAHQQRADPVPVNFAPDAAARLEAYRGECRAKHTVENSPIYMALWSRSHVKAIADAMWAIDVVNRGTEVVIQRFDSGMVGQNTPAHRMNQLEEFVRRYATTPADQLPKVRLRADLHAQGIIQRNYLRMSAGRAAAFQKDARLFDETIKEMIASGLLVQIITPPNPADLAAQSGIAYQITRNIFE